MKGNKPRRSVSIIRAATIVFMVVAILPALAVGMFEFFISSYYRGETNALTRFFKSEDPMTKLNRQSDAIMRRINLAHVENPERLLDPAFLESLVVNSRSIAIALRIEGQPIRFFGPRVHISEGKLPGFGELIDPGLPPPDPERHMPFVIDQIDFKTQDSRHVSIFVLMTPPGDRDGRPFFGFSRSLVIVVIAGLLILIGTAAIIFMRRLVKPLDSLERAAEILGAGRFDVPIVSPGVRELDPVFHAFETMRTRLEGLIGRVKAEERSRRELIANLSHDVRTPLTTVRGYVDGLKDGIANTPEKRDRYLGVLKEQAERLERMMEDIFLLATLQSRETDALSQALDLASFLAIGTEELSLSLKDRADIRFEDKAGGMATRVMADPFRLRRLVENLVRNSVEHSGRGNSVHVIVRLSLENGQAVVMVCDDGIGFPPEDLERVFDRSWRGDESRSDEGSGLGLAIAREITLAHGGGISARNGEASPPWPGAIVEFGIPVIPAVNAVPDGKNP